MSFYNLELISAEHWHSLFDSEETAHRLPPPGAQLNPLVHFRRWDVCHERYLVRSFFILVFQNILWYNATGIAQIA
ncbi:MAG: hypothetical protein K6U04_07035 [Armatimonadetes bacterium]|nr:hypothetical protein [Armatimonadota bacterium]